MLHDEIDARERTGADVFPIVADHLLHRKDRLSHLESPSKDRAAQPGGPE